MLGLSVGVKSYAVREDGLILVENERFQSVAAVYENGQGFVARGYDTDDEINEVIRDLRTSFFSGESISIRSVDIGDIQRYYDAAGLEDKGNPLYSGEITSIEERLVELFNDAAKSNISDIKFITRRNKMIVRVRIGGIEQNFGEDWTLEDGNAAIALIFDRRDTGSGQVTMEDMSFQSVSIPMQSAFPRVTDVEKMRAELGFHENGNKIGKHFVLRLQGAIGQGTTGTLESLGFDDEVMNAFKLMAEVSHGSFIVAGPTGQGKSTTLTRLLEHVYKRASGKLSIVSIEDPVEIPLQLDGVMQIPIGSAGDGEERLESYHDALRHFMRIAPDIAFISEIRDGFGAKSLVQFVSSGHRCVTTVHASSALTIPFRFIAMGVDPEYLAMPGMLRVLMAQRLLFRLCQHCAKPADDVIIDGVKIIGAKRRNVHGCPKCINENYSDSARDIFNGNERIVGVGEVIRPDDTFLECVVKNNPIDAKIHWLTPKAEGGMGGTIIERKIAEAALRGEFDIDETIHKGASEELKKICS